jgi:prepilin-type N-terminal cleavage/methylation domain-containing protein
VGRNRQQAGFTLVEVLVSIVLSAIAVIGIIALYRVQTAASAFSRRATEATVIAEDQLERLRTQAAPLITTAQPFENVNEQGKVVAGGFFRRAWSATPVPLTTYVDLVVTVEWTEDSTRQVIVRGRRNQ